jgi:uncharacterized membrane protein
MEAKAKLFGHAIHQMLIPFPLGLLATGVVFDVIYLATGNATMALVSFYMIAAGIVGGLIAAPFGLVDWMAIPQGTRAKSVGAIHGLGNVIVLLLFAASCYLRYTEARPNHAPDTLCFALAFAGAGFAVVTGWLGGELVDRLAVGVDDGANLDAPSSLSHSTVRMAASQKVRSA